MCFTYKTRKVQFQDWFQLSLVRQLLVDLDQARVSAVVLEARWVHLLSPITMKRERMLIAQFLF